MTFDIEFDVAEAWREDGDAGGSYAPGSPAGGGIPRSASILVRAPDPSRRRHLEGLLGGVAELAADVVVVDMPPSRGIPRELDRFEGALVALSDDLGVAGDPMLAGVLPRDAAPAQIRAAVTAVSEGLWVRTAAWADPPGLVAPAGSARFPNHAARASLAAADDGDKRADTRRPVLTPRELEILAQVGEGLSNKAIARRLAISAHTVKFHLEAIFAKLAVRSRAEAVSFGLRHGLLSV